MTKRFFILLKIFLLFSTLTVGCGKKEKKKTISGQASVVLGAATGRSALREEPSPQPKKSLLANERWILSPNRANVTFTRIDFVKSSSESTAVSLVDCVVTYDRALASGSNLLDCPFTLEVSEDGATFIGIYLYYKRTLEILIDDPENEIYTDPNSTSGLSTIQPAGGAQFVNYEIGGTDIGDASSQIYFTTPLTYKAGDSALIQVITDMIHTMYGISDGDSLNFETNSGSSPIELMAMPGSAVGRSEFYTDFGTAENKLMTSTDTAYVRIFYANGQPVRVSTLASMKGCTSGQGISGAFATNPDNSPIQDSSGNRSGGYLGLDSNGTLAWAFAENWRWEHYTHLFNMERTSTLTSETVLYCQVTSDVTAPLSGDTYSSGAPIIEPTVSFDLQLLAR